MSVRADNIPEIRAMSVPEKLLLLEDIWNSIAVQESEVPVPQSHIDELERRRKNLDPGSLLSLDELRARIDRRK
jgi:putative addiction module component (TIGR02574 family)